jgi:hypothetical protein
MRRSTYGFCQGDRGAVLTSWIPIVWARLENASPYMASRSRRRYRGAVSQGNPSTSCRAVHWAVGGVGDVDVDDATSLVRQDHEHEKDLEHHGGHDEEVHGDEVPQVVVEKAAQSLRWRRSMADHVLGDRCLRDLDAELLKLSVNPRRAPEGVRRGHPSDQRSDLRGDGWTAWPGPAALPGPEDLEAGPLPSDHGGGLDDGDAIRPTAPQAGKQDSEQPVGRPQARARCGALEDGQLVPQCEVLEH